MLELGKVIIARDGQRFMIVTLPNGEKGLLDLDNYRVRNVKDITDYINRYHFGALGIVESLVLNKKLK